MSLDQEPARGEVVIQPSGNDDNSFNTLVQYAHEPAAAVAKRFRDIGANLEGTSADIEFVIRTVERFQEQDAGSHGIGAIALLADLLSGDETRVTAVYSRADSLRDQAKEFKEVAEIILEENSTMAAIGRLVVGQERSQRSPDDGFTVAFSKVFDQDEIVETQTAAISMPPEELVVANDSDEFLPANLSEDRLIVLAQQVTGAFDKFVRGNTRWTEFRQFLYGLGKKVDAEGLVLMGNDLGLEVLSLVHKIESEDPEELDSESPEIAATLIMREQILKHQPQFYERLRAYAFRQAEARTAEKQSKPRPRVEVVTMIRGRHAR